MATVTAMPNVKIAGGSFLIEERKPEEVFTPEDFTEQHLLIARTAEEFAIKEIVPNIEKLEHKDFALLRELVRKAGELGLSGADVPEQYGGMELDKVTSALIADRLARYGGFSATWGAHTCIGTLPIVYFGTEQQKKKYLPGLASGETGKGHVIGFNVLNVGRFKLGAGSVGAARHCLESTIAYAKQRKAFSKVIADFGLVREKIANIAVGIFTGEAMAYRTVGQMDAAISQLGESQSDVAAIRKLIDEYAVDGCVRKVWGSEFLNYVVDEMVQIYAGYGFVEEYPAERNYRDSRINRIFEGTNEINRLVITGFLLKRAMSGHLPLMPAIKKLMDEVLSGARPEEMEGPLGEERRLVASAKKIGLFAAGVVTQKYMRAIQDQQEIMGAIANIAMETYAMESDVLRACKLVARDGEARTGLVTAMTRGYRMGAMEHVERAGEPA